MFCQLSVSSFTALNAWLEHFGSRAAQRFKLRMQTRVREAVEEVIESFAAGKYQVAIPLFRDGGVEADRGSEVHEVVLCNAGDVVWVGYYLVLAGALCFLL